jgi:hypothetical protein
VLALSVILALIVAAPMVLAQGGQGGAPTPIEETFDIPAGGVFGRCDFPIRFEASGKGKELELPGGRFISTFPGLTLTLTNLNNGHRETFNVTGSIHQTTLANGDVQFVSTGRSIFGDPEAGFVLGIGNFSYVFDKNGNLVQPLSGEGQMSDICKALA